ncbi:hypothetical protein ACOME3_003563 [Neoechinorhynchus agilis]
MYRVDKEQLRDTSNVILSTPKRFIDSIKESLDIQIQSMNSNEMEFHLKGVDPSVANAIRRTLLSDVPSMAFDRFTVLNNTSIFPDEILCHRIALIPLKADPRLFESRLENDHDSGSNSLKFSLELVCEKIENEVKFENVYSRDIKWHPLKSWLGFCSVYD